MLKATPLTRGRGVYSPVCAFGEALYYHCSQSAQRSGSHFSGYPEHRAGEERAREPPHGYHRGLSCCLRAVFPASPRISLYVLSLSPCSCPCPTMVLPTLLSWAASLPTCPSLNLPHATCPFPALFPCLSRTLWPIQHMLPSHPWGCAGAPGLSPPASQAHFVPSSEALLFDSPVTGGLEKLRALLLRHRLFLAGLPSLTTDRLHRPSEA